MPPRGWLIIVTVDRPEFFAYLRHRLAGRASVLLDRRTGRDSRRDDERRRPLMPAEAARWQELGYHLVLEPGLSVTAAANAHAEVLRLASSFSQQSRT